jgi:hypothetical protein
MEEKQAKKPSSNAFILGMIVGGAIVFLLGTKKGRKILKELSEKGLDALEEIADFEQLEMVPEDFDEIDDEFAEVKVKGMEDVNNGNESFKENGSSSSGKRFFRGIKKK